MDFIKATESVEKMQPKVEGYKEIKSDSGITDKEARNYWKNLFNDMEKKESIQKGEAYEKDLKDILTDYFEDLKEKSEFRDTLPDNPFEITDLKKLSVEETSLMREEYRKVKSKLIKEWENLYNQPWPTYKELVEQIDEKTGEITIVEKERPYELHHILPLGLGGKNIVENITPMAADVHHDHKGIHAKDSPYDKLDKMLGGVTNEK